VIDSAGPTQNMAASGLQDSGAKENNNRIIADNCPEV
jgi:hypothetical protein